MMFRRENQNLNFMEFLLKSQFSSVRCWRETWLLSVVHDKSHCVKSVQIRSFFWAVFSCIRTEYPIFGLNMGKYGPEKKIRI